MKKKKYSPERIIEILRGIEKSRAEGQTIAQACREFEIHEQTYYRWSRKYGGMDKKDAKRLRELEKENERLKKLVAELSLDKAMLEEIARGKW